MQSIRDIRLDGRNVLTIQNQTRAGKIFKCTIFVGYGGVILFPTGAAPCGFIDIHSSFPLTVSRVDEILTGPLKHPVLVVSSVSHFTRRSFSPHVASRFNLLRPAKIVL